MASREPPGEILTRDKLWLVPYGPPVLELTLGTGMARCHAGRACGLPGSESTWGQHGATQIKVPHSAMWPYVCLY